MGAGMMKKGVVSTIGAVRLEILVSMAAMCSGVLHCGQKWSVCPFFGKNTNPSGKVLVAT